MSYDVNAPILAGDLETVQNRSKEYTDDQIANVRNEIPTALPADGGNAETAKRLFSHYVGSATNNITEPKLYKMGEYHMGVSFIDTQTLTLAVYAPVSGGLIGILNLVCYGGAGVGISAVSLQWSLLVNDIYLSDFIVAFTPKGTNPETIELYFRSSSVLPRIAFGSIADFETRESGRTWTLYNKLDVVSETIPDNYIQQTSVAAIIQNNSVEVSDLKAYIGYTDSDIYGLEADFENNKFTRLAGAVGKTPGADFDSVNAFGGRKRCAVANDGTVLAYYGGENYEEDGQIGSEMAQVMVEQPKFYYKVVPLKTEKIDGADGYHLRKARYYISDTPKAGFKVHPAFVQNGVEVDKIYLSAYEGNIRDNTGSSHKYLWDDEQIADFNGDILSSVANAMPASGTTQALTRANARKLAQNRGAGWGITTIQTLSATQLLFIIEYATFDSQTAIGDGNCHSNSAPSGNPAEKTGATSSLGNASGSVTKANGVNIVTYRGEENLWGNIYKMVDDTRIVNTADSSVMVIGSKSLPVPHGSASGFISCFAYDPELDYCFIPSEITGSSALPVGDKAWQSSATNHETCMLTGGLPHYNLSDGIFCCAFYFTEDNHFNTVNARLIYIPSVEEVISE